MDAKWKEDPKIDLRGPILYREQMVISKAENAG